MNDDKRSGKKDNVFVPRTDLALEERERFKDNVEIDGVKLSKKTEKDGAVVTKMMIINDEGSKIMGKPKGTYVTIESKKIADFERRGVEKVVSDTIMAVIKSVVGKQHRSINSVLIVGLGNVNATPDALGPMTVSKLIASHNVMCIAPGVHAQTGIDVLKIIKGIVAEAKPDIVVALDSLAARNAKRIAATVQITDTGIIPGSGIGNDRMGLNRESVGVPVVAIGVPMVVSSATIVGDAMDRLINFLSGYDEFKEMAEVYKIFERDEKINLIEEITDGGEGRMFVTPKDIDAIIYNVSELLAQALNMITQGIN